MLKRTHLISTRCTLLQGEGKAVYGKIMMGARLCMCTPFLIHDKKKKPKG